jgi:predicted nucleotidyltransferase component of viral defense system
MIPKSYIMQWKKEAPWTSDLQVEQDLIINRVLIELFNQSALNEAFLFRGGTALNKIFITPPSRYSEDIDLVQRKAEAIGDTINFIQDLLAPWLGAANVKRWQGRVSINYRFMSESEPKAPMKLKIEINTNEHYNFKPIIHKTFSMKSDWFTGETNIPTYDLNELAATKLRALYQRKKGRDLFDMELFLNQEGVKAQEVVEIFTFYLKQENKTITRAVYEENLFEKMKSEIFLRDMDPLLSPEQAWDVHAAYARVMNELIAILPGNPWRGR